MARIPDADRGIFLALAHLGLRPGEARALTVADYRDGWLFVDKAAKSKSVGAEIRGTKTGKPKRLPVSQELADWIERHVDPAGRFSRKPLFPNPRTGRMWPHKALQRVWATALEAADLPHVSLYEGTKHTMATDAIRRGVPERHLQRFLGHASVQSTRRYARLADNALIEVLRPPKPGWRQPGDKGPRIELKKLRGVTGGPSWIRTWGHRKKKGARAIAPLGAAGDRAPAPRPLCPRHRRPRGSTRALAAPARCQRAEAKRQEDEW